tara:strand:- start:299 stop:478 length:180 start_codon:yes stop_codon:yes gene_type:complete
MSTIEDILYKAQELNLRDELFRNLKKIKNKDEYKYLDLKSLYEIAFNDLVCDFSEIKNT